ncbi:hypothetical protein [Pseudomonas fluorescens]|uniref:AbiTii domain-containing protein n=1 Tax=Pseudomonas fluorescens TaxID=294 RepID=UPI000686FA3B|nr:hypothetical protein [Pseudomonas fluorescens]
MSSLVQELQADALDDKVSIASLLRKAKSVSSKLNVSTIDQWLDWEMNGYKHGSTVPDYRIASGKPICLNPYRGYIPLDIEEPRLKRVVSSRKLFQPIGQLEELVSGKPGGTVLLGYGFEVSAKLMSMMQEPFEPFLEVQPSLIKGVVGAVRDRILVFALDLERQGILGEGMSFTKQEKNAASHIHYNLNVENMHGSQIQQGTTSSTQTYGQALDLPGLSVLIEKILPALGAIENSDDRSQIESDLETIRSQIKAPRPRVGIIRESLESVKAIIEGTTGNLAAEYLPLLVPLLAALPT